MNRRTIININQDKCNGCGLCVKACHEGAIKLVDGKARLINQSHCDGLGACIGECPQNAITLEECLTPQDSQFSGFSSRQWPIKLKLVPVEAPYFNNADLVIAADCTSFAYASLNQDFLKGKALIIGCPKLDDIELYGEKLKQIIKQNSIKSITYIHMAVPCCFGFIPLIKDALDLCGKEISFKEVTVGIKGEIK